MSIVDITGVAFVIVYSLEFSAAVKFVLSASVQFMLWPPAESVTGAPFVAGSPSIVRLGVPTPVSTVHVGVIAVP